MLCTNTLQNLSTQVDAVNKSRANKSQFGRGANHEGSHGRDQGGHSSHSRSVDGTCSYCGTKCRKRQCPAYGKTCKIVTRRITLLTYVDSAKGRGLLASTVTMIHPSRMKSTTEETSQAIMVSGETVVTTEATGVATSHTETFMRYKVTTSYRTSSKNEATNTDMMIMLTNQSLIVCLDDL